jgi:small basic protein (TIGR04137 family)
MGNGELYIRTLPQSETNLNRPPFMSQHNSLKPTSGGLVIKRNVLKRFERVALLKKRGQWKEGDRVQGLRKTRADV